MDHYKQLSEHLKNMNPQQISIYQGIVESVDNLSCSVNIGGLVVPDVRLRASLSFQDEQILLKPSVGSAVICGSLTNDMTQLVVLSMDKAEQIILNGGKLGGLVNIESLTEKLNQVIEKLNTHTHTSSAAGSPTSVPIQPFQKLNSKDYEDLKIKH